MVQRGWTDDLGDLVDQGVDMASNAASSVANTASNVASAVGEAASDAAGAIGDAASSAAGAVSDAASDLAAKAQALVSGAIDQLTSAYDAIAGQVSAAWGTLKGGVESAITSAIEEASGFLGGLGSIFSGVGQALLDLDAEKLKAAWGAITATASMLLGSVTGIADRVLAFLDGQFANVKAMADGLIGGLRSRAEGIIGELPSAVQGTARTVWTTIESKATGAWTAIEKAWTTARTWATDKLDGLTNTVKRIGESVNDSVIAPIVDTLSRVAGIIKIVKQAIDDPEGFIQPMVDAIVGKLQGLPEKAKDEAQKLINGAGKGGPQPAPAGAPAGPAAAPPVQRWIQRDAAKPGDPRSTLGVGTTISHVWTAITDKAGKLWGNLGDEVKKMVLSLVWPPATWAALKEDWALMTKELSARAARWESVRTDSLDAFWEDIRRFISNLVDFPLIVWRGINAMLGHLSVYIGLAIILGGAVAGAIAAGTGGAVFGSVVPGAGTAAGGGVGIAAGAWIGAQAGYAAAETVGLVLFASFWVAEQTSIMKAIGDLLFTPQTNSEQEEDVNQVGDSAIAMGAALLLLGIAFIGVKIAQKIWALIRGFISKVRPVVEPVPDPAGPKPVDPDPSKPKPTDGPTETPPGRPDALIICRVCDIVPGVPKDLMEMRAKLSPEMRQFLDSRAAKFFPDPANPTPENFKALRGFMENTAKKGGGDLEAGLRKIAPKAPPKGTPNGPRVADLPRLRSEIEALIKEIEDFAKANPDKETIQRSATKLQEQLDGPVQRMENGIDAATDDLVGSVDRSIKGAQGEFERAKVAPSGTKFSEMFGDTEVDQVRPNGDLVQVKKMRALRKPSRTFDETAAQVKRTLEIAQQNPVGGKPRNVIFEFPEGLEKPIADELRGIDVNGQHATVVAKEIVLPPK